MNQGRVMLFVGNKHGGDLRNVSLALVGTEPGLAARLAPVPNNLGPKKQVQVLLELAATRAFANAPRLRLEYFAESVDDGVNNPGVNHCSVVLETPYTVHKFLQPFTSDDKELFFQTWRTLVGKAQEVSFVRVNALVASGGIAGIEKALISCRLTPKPGYDPNNKNLVAGGIVPYTTNPNTVVMVRVEAETHDARGTYFLPTEHIKRRLIAHTRLTRYFFFIVSAFRVTVASDDPETVAGVSKALVSQIAE